MQTYSIYRSLKFITQDLTTLNWLNSELWQCIKAYRKGRNYCDYSNRWKQNTHYYHIIYYGFVILSWWIPFTFSFWKMHLHSWVFFQIIRKQESMFYVFIYFPFNAWIFQFTYTKFISQDKMQPYALPVKSIWTDF